MFGAPLAVGSLGPFFVESTFIGIGNLGHPLSDRRILVQTSFRQPFYYPPQQAKSLRLAHVGVPSQLFECSTSILERLNPIGLAAVSALQPPQEAPASV